MTRIPLRLILVGLIIAEAAVMMLAGAVLGFGWSLLLLLVAMAAGALLLRAQGTAMLLRLRGDMAARRMPAQTLLEAAAKTLAAILLIIPGFVSDLVAILVLVPPVRMALWGLAARRMHREAPRGATGGRRPQVVELGRDEFEVDATAG